MPRKIRELKADIARRGFFYLSKRVKKTLTISGKDGDDVPIYLEKQLAQLLNVLEGLREDEDS